MNSKFPYHILNPLPIHIFLKYFLSSNMATFTNQHLATTGSFLSRLMTKISAGAADVLCFIFDDKDDASSLLCEDGGDDDGSSAFGKWWNWSGGNNHGETVGEEAEKVHASPVRKKTRNVYARKPQAESTWSRNYLNPTLQDAYLVDPHGRDTKKFRTLFRVPYDLFVYLVQMSKERWWRDWTPDKVCNAGKLVSSLELKVLGALYVLGTGASQHQVGVQTHLSEEVH